MSMFAPSRENEIRPTPMGQRSISMDFYEPTTKAVVNAYVDETFSGVGTLEADIKGFGVKEADSKGKQLTLDEYKASEFFRPNVQYYNGMTREGARLLAEYNDDREKNAKIIESAGVGKTVLGFGAAFGAGIFEPKNLAAGAAVAVAAPYAGAVLPIGANLRRLYQLRKLPGQYAAKGITGGVEGMVAAAALEPSNRYTADTLRQDYTMADTLMNVGLSTALGVGFTTLPSYLKSKWDKWGARTPEIVNAEIDLATEQLATGKRVDVSALEIAETGEIAKKPPAERAAIVEKSIKEIPKIETQDIEAVKAISELPQDMVANKPKQITLDWKPDVSPSVREQLENPSSWVIRDNQNFRAVAEVTQKSVVDKINTKKYEAVPIAEHLANLNGQSYVKDGEVKAKLVRRAAFGGETIDTIAGRIDTENAKKLDAYAKTNASTESDTAIDYVAARKLDEIKTFNEELGRADTMYQQYLDDISAMKEEGILTEADSQEFIDAINELEQEAKVSESALNDIYACLTRG